MISSPMTHQELTLQLRKWSPIPVEVKLNQNISTYLSVLQRKKATIKLSLHEIFLQADEKVCQAIMGYSLKGDRKALSKLKIFTHTWFAKLDKISPTPSTLWKTKGTYFDLSTLYASLEKKYFPKKLNLSISWFPKPKYRSYRKITFGSYHRRMNLIRMNEILDHPKVPPYFIEFIIYHEMLHAVYTSQVNALGRIQIHTKEFRVQEKRFCHYQKAKEWEKKNFQNQRSFRGWT